MAPTPTDDQDAHDPAGTVGASEVASDRSSMRLVRDGGVTLSGAAFPVAQIEAALARILASATFLRSQRHRRFLEHVVAAAIDGRPERLREVAIGIEVFGRPADRYDPRRDPIVRVEAGRIRDKLVRFYADEGADDPIELSIPVGSYQPLFRRRRSKASTPRPVRSFGVLPLANLTGHRPDDALCLGIADLAIDLLGRVGGFEIVSRPTSVARHERDTRARAIGRQLGVAHLVEGNVQRSGPRVRCFLHVVRVHDEQRLWSQRFDFDESQAQDGDAFAFQDRVADALVAAIEALARPVDAVPSPALPAVDGDADGGDAAAGGDAADPPRPVDRQVRDLFERARVLMREGTADACAKAVELLDRAIVVEPGAAHLHSARAVALCIEAGYRSGPVGPLLERAGRAAARTLALAPDDGDAHAVQALLSMRVEHDWPAAEALHREALRRAPGSAFAQAAYACGLACHGRADEAIAQARTARAVDPLDLAMRLDCAFVHAHARDYPTAIAECEAILDLEPQHLLARARLGLTLLWAGRATDACRCFERASALRDDHASIRLGHVAAMAAAGEIDDARSRLAVLRAAPAGRAGDAFLFAMTHAALDDFDDCMGALATAAADRDFALASIGAVASFDRYRTRPAFAAWCRGHRLHGG